MARKIKILAVCGFGIGTSLILRMTIERVLRENGIDAEVDNLDITTGTCVPCDIVFTSRELYPLLKEKLKVPIIQIHNFISTSEIIEKGLPIIKEICNL